MSESKKSETPARVGMPDPVVELEWMFNRAITLCEVAAERIAAKDAEGKGRAINEALQIVETLDRAVDEALPLPMRRDLHRLYQYVQRQLIAANSLFFFGSFPVVKEVLGLLRDAFLKPVESPVESAEEKASPIVEASRPEALG
ncbi:MAG: flagellar protein FliS [Pseudomonadota bacterium]